MSLKLALNTRAARGRKVLPKATKSDQQRWYTKLGKRQLGRYVVPLGTARIEKGREGVNVQGFAVRLPSVSIPRL